MIKLIKFFLLSLLSIEVANASTAYEEVDFDVSMGKKNLAQYNLMLRNEESKKILDFYRAAYYEQLPSKKQPSKEEKIPKIIHQIWISDKKVPEDVIQNEQSCRNMHPDWKYELWDDAAIKKAGYDKHPLFKMFKGNTLAQKEVVQYQILRDHGGVILDMDFICLQPLNELHHKYDFYTGLKPPSNTVKHPVITASVMGAAKGYPLLGEVLEMSTKKAKTYNEKNNSYIKRKYRKLMNYFSKEKQPVRINSEYEEIISASLGEAYAKNYRADSNAIVFPCTYFSPLFPDQSKSYDVLDKMKLKMGVMTEQQVFSSKKPESIAVHYHQNK
ncbi:MAG: glycosyltransferase [Rickettsiales bacterium]